ncbi:MAG: CHASE2 domain-containing protein [Leptolyngbyaceae cyanobacterium MO_188.B28]|nr:CHASE2 domain-containing protein [Leptolyngbyaceae cyanobacterium MO_188.B28]
MELAERYRIIRVLGSGGFGQTFVAEDTQRPNCPKCVVKQLKPVSQAPKFLKIARRLFETEVSTLLKLGEHDRIPQLLDSFEQGNEFYLVQEFIEGEPLSQELKRCGRLEEPQVIEMLEDVLPIMVFIHRNQVIHRDIKPGNLIRRRDGKFVLIDFGAVKEIRTQLVSGEKTSLTVGIGTQGYTPSEQLAGKPRYSSDIYALGVTAIQLLTGRSPSELPDDPHTLELIWQNQVNVSPGLAILLSKMVRQYFSRRYQSATEVLYDLHRLEELPNEITESEGAALTYMPDWEEGRQTWKQKIKEIAIAGLTVASLVLGIRYLGGFEPPEVMIYDRLVQMRTDPGPDPRLLLVEITENDLQRLKRATPSDRTLAQLIETLQTLQPRVIGLDLYRELPQPPGHDELMTSLAADNAIVITQIGNSPSERIPHPDGIPMERVGFNDYPVDFDGVIRRNLLFAAASTEPDAESLYSFALRTALLYLAEEGIEPVGSDINPAYMELGGTVFRPLSANAGGYRRVDNKGYQILLDYRSPDKVAQQVSLTEVLDGQLNPDWVRDKIVLIGVTAASSKDFSLTPYSVGASRNTHFEMPGVIVHAQMVSQILSAVLDGQPLIGYWPDWAETLWILIWAAAGGSLAWYVRHPGALFLGGAGLTIIVVGASVICFHQRVWIPMTAPTAAFLITGAVGVAYHSYQAHKHEEEIKTLLIKHKTQLDAKVD